ncbi:MAG: hypothetical protein ACI85F_000495, partial [Bacteroidia bacterium]
NRHPIPTIAIGSNSLLMFVFIGRRLNWLKRFS